MSPSKRAFALNILRRGMFKWYGKWEAEKRSKLSERGEYYCEDCGLVCRKKDTQIDHTIPVISLTGFDNFDSVIDRLYCEPSGLRRLCISCHGTKTLGENQQRTRKPKKPRSKKKR